jgi:hypothetical protein
MACPASSRWPGTHQRCVDAWPQCLAPTLGPNADRKISIDQGCQPRRPYATSGIQILLPHLQPNIWNVWPFLGSRMLLMNSGCSPHLEQHGGTGLDRFSVISSPRETGRERVALSVTDRRRARVDDDANDTGRVRFRPVFILSDQPAVQVGEERPGDDNQSFIWEAVSSWRALRSNSSRSLPWGSLAASCL